MVITLEGVQYLEEMSLTKLKIVSQRKSDLRKKILVKNIIYIARKFKFYHTNISPCKKSKVSEKYKSHRDEDRIETNDASRIQNCSQLAEDTEQHEVPHTPSPKTQDNNLVVSCNCDVDRSNSWFKRTQSILTLCKSIFVDKVFSWTDSILKRGKRRREDDDTFLNPKRFCNNPKT